MMSKQKLVRALLGAAIATAMAGGASASTFIPNDPAYPDIRITEYMYNNVNSPAEFVQFTNLGTTAVDMTGWSEDDNDFNAGVHSLSGFGTLQPGESAILAETTQAAFDAAWGMSSSVPFVEENTKDNLGSSDAISLFDASGNIVDELVYGGSSGTSDGPSTKGVAAVPGSASVIGTNDAAGWVLLAAGQDGAVQAIVNGVANGDIASPGYSSFASVAPVPLPASAWLLLGGLGGLLGMGRRRKA